MAPTTTLLIAGLMAVVSMGPGTAFSATPAPPVAVEVAGQTGTSETTRTYSVDATQSDQALAPGTILPHPAGTPWLAPPDDAMMVRHNPQAYPDIPLPQLLISDGTRFSQPFSAWDTADRHDCAWGDYDRDGYVDLFCAVGLDATSVNGLWRNGGDGTFKDVTASQGLGDETTTHGKYRTATFVDANGDGWPDIYVTRFNGAESGMFPSPSDTYPNELWLNDAGRGFHLDTSLGLTVTASAQKDNDGCAQAFDYDANGTQDVIMCGSKTFRLYRNDGPRFASVAGSVNLKGFWADAEWGDFNTDGRADLVQVKGTTIRVMEQTATHSFTEVWRTAISGGLNVSAGDMNGDAALDIYEVGTCTSTNAGLIDQPDRIFFADAGNVATASGAPLAFQTQQIPSLGPASKGCGNAVDAIDYNRDGNADMLVANGRMKYAGPVQLWTVP